MSRPGWFNNTLRPKLGLEVKEDYILRPIIEAYRVYKPDDGYAIKQMKWLSESLEKELNGNPDKIQTIKNKLNDIVKNIEILIFFVEDEYHYDQLYGKSSLEQRIKKINPSIKWDLRTSNYYYYRNKNGEDVEIPSLYDKIVNIEDYYNNSINKYRNDKRKKENMLYNRLNKFRKNGRMIDSNCMERIMKMEEYVSSVKHKEDALDEFVSYLNNDKICDNDGMKSVAEEIIQDLCLRYNIDRRNINKLHFSQPRREPAPSAPAPSAPAPSTPAPILDEIGTPNCPSAGQNPVYDIPYNKQVLLFHPDKNPGCKNQDAVNAKFWELKNKFNRAGGYKRSQKNKRTKNKRANNKKQSKKSK